MPDTPTYFFASERAGATRRFFAFAQSSHCLAWVHRDYVEGWTRRRNLVEPSDAELAACVARNDVVEALERGEDGSFCPVEAGCSLCALTPIPAAGAPPLCPSCQVRAAVTAAPASNEEGSTVVCRPAWSERLRKQMTTVEDPSAS